MKKLYNTILLFAILSFVSTVSKSQWIQTGGPLGGYVYDFAFLDTNVYSANAGAVYRSTINGSTWSISGLAGKYLYAIEASPDGSGGMNLFATSQGDGVFLSTDSGNTWNPASNGLSNLDALGLAVTPNGTGGSVLFVGLLNGGIYRSTDNGASWNPTGPITATVFDIASSDSIVAAATVFGVYLSDDNGLTWNPAGLSSSLVTSVAIAKDSGGSIELFAAVYGDGVYRTPMNNLNWVLFNTGLLGLFPNDFAVQDSSIYVSLYGFGVFTTKLNSTSWTSLNTIGNNRTISIYNSGSATMFFMGNDDGTGVFRSPDGTSPALFVEGMINTNVVSVASISNGAGTSLLFAGSKDEDGKIMRSSDYGANWNFSYALNTFAVRSFPHNVSGTMLIAGGLDVGSWQSPDSGGSWNQCLPDGVWSVAYAPSSLGGYKVFAITGSGINLTTNSGSNWSPINGGLGSSGGNALCISDTNIFAGTYQGVYTMSINGNTWTSASSGINSPNVISIAAQGNHLFAGTYSGGLYHSSNYGMNWSPISVGPTTVRANELIFNGSTLLAATNVGVYLTDDYGITWTPFNTGLLDTAVNDLTVIDSFLVAGTRLGVWIRSLAQVPTGIGSENACNSNDCFELRVYPNPFSNSTSIEFTIREKDFVNVEIYDLQGKCVSTLVNEILLPGNYNYSLDAGEFSQGIYFLRITSALQTETRRLLRME